MQRVSSRGMVLEGGGRVNWETSYPGGSSCSGLCLSY